MSDVKTINDALYLATLVLDKELHDDSTVGEKYPYLRAKQMIEDLMSSGGCPRCEGMIEMIDHRGLMLFTPPPPLEDGTCDACHAMKETNIGVDDPCWHVDCRKFFGIRVGEHDIKPGPNCPAHRKTVVNKDTMTAEKLCSIDEGGYCGDSACNCHGKKQN